MTYLLTGITSAVLGYLATFSALTRTSRWRSTQSSHPRKPCGFWPWTEVCLRNARNLSAQVRAGFHARLTWPSCESFLTSYIFPKRRNGDRNAFSMLFFIIFNTVQYRHLFSMLPLIDSVFQNWIKTTTDLQWHSPRHMGCHMPNAPAIRATMTCPGATSATNSSRGLRQQIAQNSGEKEKYGRCQSVKEKGWGRFTLSIKVFSCLLSFYTWQNNMVQEPHLLGTLPEINSTRHSLQALHLSFPFLLSPIFSWISEWLPQTLRWHSGPSETASEIHHAPFDFWGRCSPTSWKSDSAAGRFLT